MGLSKAALGEAEGVLHIEEFVEDLTYKDCFFYELGGLFQYISFAG